MEIIKGIEVRDLLLLLKKNKTLVIGDVHIGYEEALNKQGLLVPRVYFKEMMQRIEKICSGIDFDTVVITGDLKHEFGKISETEWRNTLRFLDLFRRKKIVLVRGNHDTILGPIAKKRNLEIVDHHVVGDVLIVHGDKIVDIKKIEKESSIFKTPSSRIDGSVSPEGAEFAEREFKFTKGELAPNNEHYVKNKRVLTSRILLSKKDKVKIKTIIIGHEHPAILLEKNRRAEKYRCFLKGKYGTRELIVVPSFNLVHEGTNILAEELLSPYLKKSMLNKLEVYIAGEDETFYFGKIKDLKQPFTHGKNPGEKPYSVKSSLTPPNK